jgi:hypothetical protein
VVEHVSTCKKKDEDQTDRSPEVAVLQYGINIRPGDTKKGDSSKNSSYSCNPKHIINWANNSWMRAARKVPGEPGLDIFSRLGSGRVLVIVTMLGFKKHVPASEFISYWVGILNGMFSCSWSEE